MPGRIAQISVSDGGVPKLAVSEVDVTRLGLKGDRQRFLKVHGGPERAVCLFSSEVLQRLRSEGHPVQAGSLGENVTIEGIAWERLGPGSRLRLGERVRLEITRPASPCNTIVPYFAKGTFQRIDASTHPGESRLYARVLEEGRIRTGDSAVLEP